MNRYGKMAAMLSPTQVAGEYIQHFESWYQSINKNTSGYIDAGTAAQFLKKSNISDNILSKIWDISDPGGKGYLEKEGFFVALKMVALVQSGREANLTNINISTPIPNMVDFRPQLIGPPQVAAPPPPVQNVEVWVIKAADKTRYDQIFNSLGPEANKIHGNKVRGVMLNSKLPTDTLGKIWDLSDMDKDGSLDRAEFCIAMHLIYKVLENHTLPDVLPPEMVSSARIAAGQGPVPAPLAPPSQAQSIDAPNSQGPPPAPWVVSATDKSRYDVMFHNADIDKDGFVSGQEIKGIFLQSGLPQMVLAHIWNICDMKQIGKLTSEEFALAMWLVQQKIAGVDPPAALTPEMIPPALRPKPTIENSVPAKPSYSNPELQAVAIEIDELNSDKMKLEADMQQKEASMRLKNSDLKNLVTELETLNSTLKQLENQKGAAQKKLDELGQQKRKFEAENGELCLEFNLEQQEVESLRIQVDEQEVSLREQEEEVMSKQRQLNELREEEMGLEASVLTTKSRLDQTSNKQQQTQLFLSQVKTKMTDLQELEHTMTEQITLYDTAINSDDVSQLPESVYADVPPYFLDQQYMSVGDESPKQSESPLKSPEEPQVNGMSSDSEQIKIPKGKDTSFIGGHDPFAQAFGRPQAADPFTNWNSTAQPAATSPATGDPFGSDSFASQQPPPALEKKTKPPPPRPAPPKSRPAKPPPPQYQAKTTDQQNSSDGFADFSNFANFNTQSISSGSVTLNSPWSSHRNRKPRNRTSFQASKDFKSGFGDSFGSSMGSSLNSQPLKSSSFKSSKNRDRQNPTGLDPFGDYDPFKSLGQTGDKDFSWEQEVDPFDVPNFSSDPKDQFDTIEEKDKFFTHSHSKDQLASTPSKQALLSLSSNSPEKPGSQSADPWSESLNTSNPRSRSALGDPFSILNIKKYAPTRSKTSLGNPLPLDMDFDPLSSNNNTTNNKRSITKSNQDLLNESFSVPSVPLFSPLENEKNNNSWGSQNHTQKNINSKEYISNFSKHNFS